MIRCRRWFCPRVVTTALTGIVLCSAPVLTPGGGLLAQATAPLGNQQMQQCVSTNWRPSSSVIVPDSSQRSFLSGQFDLAVRSGTAYVMGTLLDKETAKPAVPKPFLARRLDGRDLGAPPAGSVFAYPRGSVDVAGRLHVLWAEQTEPDTFSFGMPLFGRVMYAQYRRGQWTAAEEVYRAPRVMWYVNASSIVQDASGTMHISFPVHDRTKGFPFVVYLRSGPEGWHVTEFTRPFDANTQYGGGGLYPALAVASRGRVSMGLIGTVQHPRPPGGRRVPDSNSVFFMRSTDGGDTWTEPLLVSLSGMNQASDLQIAATGADTLHLAWGKNLSGGYQAQVAWHAVSTDGGTTWSKPAEIPVPIKGRYRPENFRFYRRGPGSPLHLAFLVQDRTGGSEVMDNRIYHTWWNGRQWATAEPLRPETQVMGFDIGVERDGRLHLVWESRDAPDTGNPQATVNRIHHATRLLCPGPPAGSSGQ